MDLKGRDARRKHRRSSNYQAVVTVDGRTIQQHHQSIFSKQVDGRTIYALNQKNYTVEFYFT
jgi:hypothetical protein